MQKLEAARLIRWSGDRSQIEMAHEALIRNWPTLNDWLDEERNRLRFRYLIKRKAEHWQDRKRSSDLLLSEADVEESNRFKDFSDLELTYINESKTE